MITPAHTPLRNKSGSIAAGGTAQNVYAKNDAPRFYLHFRNISTEAMWLEFGAVAVADRAIYLAAGEAYEFPAGVVFDGALSVLAATTGSKFICKIA